MESGHQRTKRAIVTRITTALIVGISAIRHSRALGMVHVPTKENVPVTQVTRVTVFAYNVPKY